MMYALTITAIFFIIHGQVADEAATEVLKFTSDLTSKELPDIYIGLRGRKNA